MKAIFHIVAVLVLLAALFFGYNLKTKYEEQLAATAEKIQQIKVVSKNIDDKTATKKITQATRDASFAKKEETKGQLELEKSKFGELNRSLAKVETRAEEAQAELDNVNELIATAQKDLPGVTLAELPGEIKRLNDQKNTMERQLEELELLADKLNQAVAKTKTDINREQGILGESKKRVADNDFEASIKTVNNQWGFVVVGAGENAGLTGASKLLVQRDGRLIGKLSISTLENSQAIAEVIPNSLAPGARILPGDRVILAETIAN